MLKKIEAGELPIIKLFLETLKEVSDVAEGLRGVFKNSDGYIDILDTDPFHALLDIYDIPGETLLYCRDGLVDAYCDFLRGEETADNLIVQIVEVTEHIQRLYKEHGEELYAPFDMEQYLALHSLQNAS